MAIAYVYDGTLYVALTRRCTLRCTFCPKTHGRRVVAGNDMRHDPEPSAEEVLAAVERLAPQVPSKLVAFVGLGEPTMRLPVLLAVGPALKARGFHVRVVTDGLANLREGRDVTAELAAAVDEVSVSLNAPTGEVYAALCPNPHGAAAHAEVCRFLEVLRTRPVKVLASVVTAPGVDVAACEVLAKQLGVTLRVRPWFDPLAGEPHEQASARGAPAAGA